MGKNVEKLSAQISVEDKATKNLEKITKSIQKQNNELLRMKASMERLRAQSRKKTEVNIDTKKAVSEVSRLDKAFRGLYRTISDTGRIMRGLGGFTSKFPGPGMLAIGGIGGAVGGGYAAKQTFDNTFLKSAEFEMSNKTIQAMFNDKKKSDLYIKEMQNMAIGSPLLNSQDIFGNSKSFIALSKSQNQLTKMWDLAERLLAVDPKQGIEGSVFALRELFSGDSRSMAERFELSKKVLNDIKDLPLEKQLKELDKYFNKMGMTKKLVNEMGDTTLGVWNQIKETTEVGLRRIGDPAVKIIKPLLDDINKGMQEGKLNNFVKIGQDIASSIAKGFVKTTRGVGGWIKNIYEDPEFKKLTTVSAKVGFVFEDIHKKFQDWINTGGQEKINSLMKSMFVNLSTAAVASQDIIVSALGTIGKAAGTALVQEVDAAFVKWQIDLWEKNPIFKLPGMKHIKEIAVTGMSLYKPKEEMPNFVKPHPARGERENSHAFGLQRVPRNNYPALLHEGERVLTKQQVNQVNRSTGVTLQIGDVHIHNEMDYQNFVSRLVKDIESHLVSYGGEPA